MADLYSSYVKIQFIDGTTFSLRYWELVWYSVILFTGALGNLLVCLAFCKSGSEFRGTPFNKLLCSLAIADVLLALTVLPNYLLSTPIFNHPHGIWGDVMCKTITGDFLPFYFSNVSEYSLLMICIERLQSVQIFQSTKQNDSLRRRRIWPSVVTAWSIPFLLEGPRAIYVLEYKRKQKPIIGNFCTFSWGSEPALSAKIYGCIILVSYGLIPLIIFTYSFYTIRKCLLREEKRMSAPMQGNGFSDGYSYYLCWKTVQRRKKTAKILMIVTAVFVVCWMPKHIMFCIINYVGHTNHNKLTWNSPVYQIGLLIGFTGSCINPFLYAWQSREFRRHSNRALKSLLPKCLNDAFGYRQIKDAPQRNQEKNNVRNISTSSLVPVQIEREGQAASSSMAV